MPAQVASSGDASVSAARSNIEFFIFNTINASLGPDTPTSFRPRDYIQTEVAANLDFSHAMEMGGLAVAARPRLGRGMAPGDVRVRGWR